MCNYSNVTNVNCDLHLLKIIKTRSSALTRREERFNTKIQGVNSSLANHGSGKSPFISENIITMHLQVLTRRFTGFSDLPLFYCHYINYYPNLRCQVFLSLLPGFLQEIMNFYLLLMQFQQLHCHFSLCWNYLPKPTQGSHDYWASIFTGN